MPYNDFVGGYLLLPLTLKLCVYCIPPKELFMASKIHQKVIFLSFGRQTRAQNRFMQMRLLVDEWVELMQCNPSNITENALSTEQGREIKTLILRRMIVKF